SRRERLRRRQNLDWMSRLPEELLAVPLWNLALPGSHDSMSFCLDVTSPVVRSEPRLLRLIDRLLPCWTRRCIRRWASTQVHNSCTTAAQQLHVFHSTMLKCENNDSNR
uniref:Uncharacterized protein n=1 Tax=Mola mola TaxID=94237 RepID=A0A3Q3XCL5_MOLML